MAARDAASERQVQAADPTASTWLSANAGSGKTRVLTDRVARLLLAGVAPQNILCLTYTRAAAAEMQNRLFRRLGEWAMLGDAELVAALAALGVEGAPGADVLRAARRLFARAIETPGGLRIQTIHSFCAALLRRFPLEAGVTPAFTELDARTAANLRADIVEAMAGGDGPEAAAVDNVARYLADSDLARLTDEILRHRDGIPPEADDAGLWALFGLPAGFDEATLEARAFTGTEGALLADLVPALAAGSANDAKAAARLKALGPVPGVDDLPALEGVLLYGATAAAPFGAKTGAFPTRATRAGLPPALVDALEALMARIEAARPLRLALAAARRTDALHAFARAFLARYDAAKAARGWLDFDDLIRRARRLLSEPSVAAWVLYRLDGGIDHILVDEAQDTSPEQWRVIELLAQEFTAGDSARDDARRGERTIFVVGDKKQSIYSFQGADLRAFDRMQAAFRDRLAAVGVRLQEMVLEYSFRSAEPVLRLVDAAFAAGQGGGLGGEVRHLAFQADLPGRVDLWPPVPKAPEPDHGAWFDPVDLPGPDDAEAALAGMIAGEIARLLAEGTAIPTRDGPRPLRPGDVMILVQRRRRLFHEIIRACKAAGLPIAGADVMQLGAELAVRDIVAVLAVLATPEDDLSLAAALRSPLFGWSEDALFRLAHGRPGYLWQALRGGDDPARAVLEDLRDQADFLRPYELIERLLVRHDGRRRLLARLGPEAEDGIDALLAQALAYERTEVPGLTGFLAWFAAGDAEVKRSADTSGRVIRVMTVHGAKGLEAPVVILPETQKRGLAPRDAVVAGPGGVALWRPPAAEAPGVVAAAMADLAARIDEENARLLYVAATRAECWLILCAAGDTGDGLESWHARLAGAMDAAGAVALETPAGPGLRLSAHPWPAPEPAAPDPGTAAPPLPGWLRAPAPAAPRPPQPLSPSALGGAKALPGEGGDDPGNTAAALARGTLLHRLLEHLPAQPRAAWPALAAALGGPDAAALLAEAERVLAAPELAFLFAPGTLAEVEIAAAPILGTIDRLVIAPDRVLAADFKSNRVVPATPEAVPEGLLRQMGAYDAALAAAFPGRRIETALVWTGPARLMRLPPDLVRRAWSAVAPS